jgi:N-ethylmaleimide reductase
MVNLFSRLDMGVFNLEHRVVMAPLTRMRASVPGYLPNEMMAEYYGQRACKGGLIISEATLVSEGARGAPNTPGIYTDEQIDAWRRITDAVHAKGGRMVLQLWHMGRLSHPQYQPDGLAPFAPSDIRADVDVLLPDRSKEPCPVPREIETDAIPDLVNSFVQAARNAMDAGFDGVEIHAANGYLLEQFLQSRSNQRSDAYGGSIENRCRLVIEIAQHVIDAIGEDRTGIRLSPFGIANDSGEENPEPLYDYLVAELDKLGLAYLHLIEPRASGAGQKDVDHKDVPSAARLYRSKWSNALITAGNFTGETARKWVEEGIADAIAFGRYFISNPDLPARIERDHPLTPYDRSTFYSLGEKGYLDYPTMDVD